jgi:hypothetical protein
MTALGRREVKRTFSSLGQETAGLPRPETHEAGRQDRGDFGNSLSRSDGAAIRSDLMISHTTEK